MFYRYRHISSTKIMTANNMMLSCRAWRSLGPQHTQGHVHVHGQIDPTKRARARSPKPSKFVYIQHTAYQVPSGSICFACRCFVPGRLWGPFAIEQRLKNLTGSFKILLHGQQSAKVP